MGLKRQARREHKPRMMWAAMEKRATLKFSTIATLHWVIEQGGEQAIAARAQLQKMHTSAVEDKTPGAGEYYRDESYNGARGTHSRKRAPKKHYD